jgi:hypothetical protein
MSRRTLSILLDKNLEDILQKERIAVIKIGGSFIWDTKKIWEK